MTVELYHAPVAGGKTTFALHLARYTAHQLQAEVRVCVPSRLQARSWRQRLALAGGAIGVRVLTFDRLVTACLDAAGESYAELNDAVQYRLLRALVAELPLRHYAPLQDKPGFAEVLRSLLFELKSNRIEPAAFQQAVVESGGEPRLVELAVIYAAYQEKLQAYGWADRVGLNWLAVEAWASRAEQAGRDWPLLIVDGFDNFTPIQLALLKQIGQRASRLVTLLTDSQTAVYPRFRRTIHYVENALQVKAQPLPATQLEPGGVGLAPALRYLADRLGMPALPGQAGPPAGRPAVHLLEAPNRAAEVRAALRWLKQRLVEDNLTPNDIALLAHDLSPYRPAIVQIAAEFGLPIYLADGVPLAGNPAVAALLDLMQLCRPDENGQPALPRRLVVQAWRCPYFDWPAAGVTIGPADADQLDRAARLGRVVGGLKQWQAALRPAVLAPAGDDEEEEAEQQLAAAMMQALAEQFAAFYAFIAPPGGHSGRDGVRLWVAWLEALIGLDTGPSLQLAAQAQANPATAVRDLAALQALKEVLRGLVWADEALHGEGSGPRLTYPEFLAEVRAAVEAALYQLPMPAGPGSAGAILVASVTQARGLSFQAAALMGMAEGLFPAVIAEDPFLRDSDRQQLRDRFGFPLEPSAESAEREFFYEAVARASQKLLLTRPRLEETGAEWLASPFWEQVRRLLAVQPLTLTSEQVVLPAEAASWPELLESVAVYPADAALLAWLPRLAGVKQASRLFRLRRAGSGSVYDGDLSEEAAELGRQFGPEHIWSASRLERYRSCGYYFFTRNVLALEPRQEPEQGVGSRQLGGIYHRIFEAVYRDGGPPAGMAAEAVQPFVTRIANPILDAAPEQEGFQETAWWAQTRQEIIDNVVESVLRLAELADNFSPLQVEALFDEATALVIAGESGDSFRLRGFIDRVDRDDAGRIRIIDYKSGGPGSFNKQQVEKGKKLQLTLYALAAQEALGLGEVADAFYWHFLQGKPGDVTLAKLGVANTLATAVAHAWEAVQGVRAGRFQAEPPEGGCPAYCPAAAYCWHYTPGWRG